MGVLGAKPTSPHSGEASHDPRTRKFERLLQAAERSDQLEIVHVVRRLVLGPQQRKLFLHGGAR